MKRFIFRLAALGMGLAFTVLALELALRFTGPSEAPPPVSAAVREVAGRGGHLPHHRPAPEPAEDATPFRILVFGDSFSWGAGVFHRDAYPERLESLLERIAGGRLDVELELRVRPGWNTSQEIESLEYAPLEQEPDLIVLGYCLNDAELDRREGNEDIAEPLLRREPTGLSAAIYEQSRIYRRFRDRLESARQRQAFTHYYSALYERVGWQDSLAAFDGFKRLAEEKQAPIIAMIFPIFDQELGPRYSYRDLHDLVSRELSSRGFRVLDLLPEYQGIAAQRLAVEPFTDPHPNELAHRIASQVLAKYLLDEDLVPIDPEKIYWKSIDLAGTREAAPPESETNP